MNKSATAFYSLSPRSPMSNFSSFEGSPLQKSKLVESIALRKQAEEEAQALANRIALLEYEEQKTMKKAHDARKKADDIMIKKTRNLAHAQYKNELRREREQAIEKQRYDNRTFRQQILAGQERSRREMFKEIKYGVEDLKRAKEENMTQAQAFRDNEWIRSSQVVQKIKVSERHMQEKKRKQQEEIKEKARKTYEAKILHQMSVTEDTNKMVGELEKREAELVRRLQNTVSLKRIAFENLEKALSASVALPEVTV